MTDSTQTHKSGADNMNELVSVTIVEGANGEVGVSIVAASAEAAAAAPASGDEAQSIDFDDDFQADRARSGAQTAAPYAPSVSIMGAAESAAQVPPPVVLATPSHRDEHAAAAPPHARNISVDPSTPQPAANGVHMHLPGAGDANNAAAANSAPAGLFSPTRPLDTPLAANASLNIFSPTRPANTPAANAPAPSPASSSSPASSPSGSGPIPPPRPPRPAAVPYSRRASLLNKSHLNFKTCLKHQFPLIDAQVGAGQALVKRVSNFLKRVCELSESHAASMMKLSQAEEGRSETSRLSDAMADHVKVANQVATTVEALALRDSLFAQKVLGLVVKPLQLWLPGAEDRRSKMVKEEKAASSSMHTKNSEAEKIRIAGVKYWSELSLARKELLKEKSAVAPNPAALDKAAKKVAKAKESARREFAKFEALKDSIVARTVEYRGTTMPTLLQGMEDLERERLVVLRKALGAYTALLREAVGSEPPAPLAILSVIEGQVALLNPTVDMNGAMDRWVTAHGMPPSDPPMVLDLPCHSDQLAPESNAWEAAMVAAAAPCAAASPPGASASSAHARQPSTMLHAGPGGLGAIGEEDGSGAGAGAASATAASASSSSSGAGTTPLGEAVADEEEEDEEDDTLSTTLSQTICESWYIAQVDHPLPHAAAAAAAAATAPAAAATATPASSIAAPAASPVLASASSASASAASTPPADEAAPASASASVASSPSGALLPLLRFHVDDILRVTDKSASAASGGEGWWVGSLVSDLTGTLGRFPRALVRSVDDKDAKAAPVEAAGGEASSPAPSGHGSLADLLRGKVSKKKKRFQQDGFDLDLTYILPNIIAMGFPSEGLEGQYRNNMIDVQRFFKTRHPDNYKLYNLCSERFYDAAKFDGRVSRHPFDDHNPCPFDQIMPIMQDIDGHLNPGGVPDPARVAAIHCKAGKGRTGFIICCWLLYNRMFPSYDPSLALRFYAVKRTKNQKGVTIPSQIRYVIYFARWLRFERGLARFPTIPARNPVLLQTIRLLGIPRATTGKDVWFKLVQNDGTKYSSKGKAALERRLAEDYLLFQARDASGQGITALDADCNITFYCGGMFDTTKLFQFWFNTRMIGVLESAAREGNSDAEQEHDESRPRSLILTKAELDKACKDVHHKLYADTFRIELIFTSP